MTNGSAIAAGRVLGQYTLTRLVGQGGMASVWEASNAQGQRVAIKTLKAEFSDRLEVLARFFLEARNASQVGHPGIVKVLDAGQAEDGAPWLVMELLEGLALNEFLAAIRQPLSGPQACGVLAPVLDAMSAAHAAGVVHRDLKPHNLFIHLPAPGHGTPQIKIVDFGISLALGHDTRVTQTGTTVGTPAYMAPEQLEGRRDVGTAADVYSLGAIGFELLTGRRAWKGDNPLALAAQVLSQRPPKVETLRPEVAALGRVIDRAMSREPADRWPSVADFRRALISLVAPDTQWCFERAAQLTRQPAADVAAPFSLPPVVPPPPPVSGGAELSLTTLLDRLEATGRHLAPELGVRLLTDLLLDPSTPPATSPALVRVSPSGTVRALAFTGRRVQSGGMVRTWLAPEAWDGRASVLSTQFSLAAVLATALTGKPPFEARDDAALRALLNEGLPPPYLAALPPALQPVVVRMLSPRPEHRYPDAGSCVRELTLQLHGAPRFAAAHDELAALHRFARLSASAAAPPPAATRAPLGRWLLAGAVFVLASGGLGWRLATTEASAAVDANEPRTSEALRPSRYRLSSTPAGAALWLEDHFRGNLPGTLSLEGAATLRLELPGHLPRELRLEPDDGQRELNVVLTPRQRLLRQGTVRRARRGAGLARRRAGRRGGVRAAGAGRRASRGRRPSWRALPDPGPQGQGGRASDGRVARTLSRSHRQPRRACR